MAFLYTSNELLKFQIKNKQIRFYNCTRNRKYSGIKLKRLSTVSKYRKIQSSDERKQRSSKKWGTIL